MHHKLKHTHSIRPAKTTPQASLQTLDKTCRSISDLLTEFKAVHDKSSQVPRPAHIPEEKRKRLERIVKEFAEWEKELGMVQATLAEIVAEKNAAKKGAAKGNTDGKKPKKPRKLGLKWI
jgi:hypothetical protein